MNQSRQPEKSTFSRIFISALIVFCLLAAIIFVGWLVLRADGLSIDFVTGPEGSGFTVDNPNQPAGVRQLSARELKAMIDSGRPFELVDVRTEEERAMHS